MVFTYRLKASHDAPCRPLPQRVNTVIPIKAVLYEVLPAPPPTTAPVPTAATQITEKEKKQNQHLQLTSLNQRLLLWFYKKSISLK